MGLCKCPKRCVTNQFCFEHRVNVCEHCMVTNHPKCIVRSYLQWLQDNDYNPICELCAKNLDTEDCIRLTCYHVYHWWCLDSWARNLPADTAPAGYTCPTCHNALFPPTNLVSPVADVLKEKLAGVNWARTGLGLPLLSEEISVKSMDRIAYQQTTSDVNALPTKSMSPPHSVIHMPDINDSDSFSRSGSSLHASSAPRRGNNSDIVTNAKGVLIDHDDDKYKRRSAGEWLLRKWKYLWSPGRGRRHWRPIMVIVLVILLILLILGAVGRLSIDDNDPAFDVKNHPLIKQGDR